MNIYLHELRMYRRGALIWTAALCILALFMLSLFPPFYSQVKEVTAFLNAFPQAFLDAFGVSLAIVASLEGFYSFVVLYIVLCGAIQAMNLGTSLLAKETSSKTVDFILTKPLGRAQIIHAKLLAGLTILAATNVAYLVVVSVVAWLVSPIPFNYGTLLLMSLPLLFVQLIFFAFGFLYSVLKQRIRAVVPISLATVFGFYIVASISSALKDNQVRFLTPFRYFDPIYLINNGTYELSYVLLSLGLISVTVALGYIIYQRRDIQAV
ncbi:MAG: ABC transporter permease subunit [Anaerolineae bacterium]